MSEFHAGYFIEPIIKELANNNLKSEIGQLLSYLSHFDLQSNKDLNYKVKDPVAVIINNMICRGLPTLPSVFIENRIANTFVKTGKNKREQQFYYNFINDELKPEILRSLYIIEPRFTLSDLPSNFYTSSNLSKYFINEFIPINIGNYFIQLLSKERTISDIYKSKHEQTNKYEDILNNTINFDYSVELPYPVNNKNGLTIEFESPVEQFDTDYKQQQNIDNFLNSINWQQNTKINSFDYDNISESEQNIIDFTFDTYFDTLRKNYTTPLYTNQYGLDAMQIALTPLAVARIQKTIVTFILSGQLNLDTPKWKIAIFERDVPAAFLAIEDLKHIFTHLFSLEGEGRSLPEIDLSIYYTPEFEEAELNVLYQGKIAPIEDFDTEEKFDLFIDLSILLRSTFSFAPINSKAELTATIRSVAHTQAKRYFLTAPNISYNIDLQEHTIKSTAEKEYNKKIKSDLNYFYKNLFRYHELDFLQFRFLNKILTNNNTLASLPPKENKDSLYQLITMLQPGISIIVTPMMSTLKYQLDELQSVNIDSVSYFSASTQKIFDKYSALKKLEDGQSLFNYIMPDRLHIQDFRETLRKSIKNNTSICYIIVDEAHCASPWSHNFRPLYATIYNNIQIIFKNNKIPVFACLTETASYDTITDVAIKFNIEPENTIKVDTNVKNIDLKFKKIQTNTSADATELIKTLAQSKADSIKNELESRTVIFSNQPKLTQQRLEQSKFNTQTFLGSLGDRANTISTIKSRTSYKNYRKYRDNKADILITSYTLAAGVKLAANKVYIQDIPVSVELLIHTLSRLISDQTVECVINYGNEKLQTTKDELKFKENGELYEISYTQEVSTENLLRHDIFDTHNISSKKEIRIINELLNQITYSNESINDILIRRIRYSFDQWIRTESQPATTPTKLYIYDKDDENLGYIDFEENNIVNLASLSKKEVATQILTFLKFDIEKIVSNGKEIFLIIDDNINVNTSRGINNLWATMKKGEQTTITIEFYNNSADKIIKKLHAENGISIKLNNIIDIYESSYNEQTFVRKFKSSLKLTDEIHNKLLTDINELFWNFRNFFDTTSSLYQLLSINIIEDFIIDYQNQQFTVIFTKKQDTDIINCVYKQIRPFLTKNKALEVYEKLSKTHGTSMIEKAINYYEKFSYEYIYHKKLQSYNYIEKLINNYIGEANKITPLLNNYFSAKYILEFKEILNNEFSYVTNLFDKKDFLKDDLQHIRKSSSLLLNTHQDNYILLLINGISGALISDEDNEILNNSINNIAKALAIYRKSELTPNISLKLEWVLKLLSKYNIEIFTKTKTLLTLKIHTEWLSDINKKLSFFKKSKIDTQG